VHKTIAWLFAFQLACCAFAQPSNPAALAARNWRVAHERAIVREFIDLLAIPNMASDRLNIRKNAVAIVGALEKRGVKARLLETPGVPPVVYGQLDTPGATRTITFYAHYDGQPLDPKEWATRPGAPCCVTARSSATAGSYPSTTRPGSVRSGGSTRVRHPTTRRRSSPS
jgi:hypothetical protein